MRINPFVNMIYWIVCGMFFSIKGYKYKSYYPIDGPYNYYMTILIGPKSLSDKDLLEKYYMMTFTEGIDYKSMFLFVFKNPIKTI